MHSQSGHKHSSPNRSNVWRGLMLSVLITPFMGVMPQALAAEIYSAHVDREAQKIIIRGTGFNQSTTLTLGGVSVNTANVTGTELDIPFAAAVYLVVQWEGSYNLIVDDINRITVYIEAPILAPPPPGGPDCPCIAGWEGAGLFPDTFLCGDGTDGTQSYIFGNSFVDNSFISAAFDPNNIFFDEDVPGNSISYCALIQNNVYTVAEPVVNQDQYTDCYAWMWANICL